MFKTPVYFIVILLIFMSSCGASKAILASGEASAKVAAKQVITQHYNAASNFNTLQGKVRIAMLKGEKSQSALFTIRMQKDSVIWVSAPLGLARLKLTPTSVQFYSKQDKSFFNGDYTLLSNFAGIDLNFQQVQRILLGEAIYNLNRQKHAVTVVDKNYQLAPLPQQPLLELFYTISPTHFKTKSQQVYQAAKKRMLQIEYLSYQNVDGLTFPKAIAINAVEDNNEVSIQLNFKTPSFNQPMRFPFKIPEGYNPIQL